VASANSSLFTEQRAAIPDVGELIRYGGKTYQVLTVFPQEPPLGRPPGEAAPLPSALVRVQLTG
jgi:hypothetical protein